MEDIGESHDITIENFTDDILDHLVEKDTYYEKVTTLERLLTRIIHKVLKSRTRTERLTLENQMDAVHRAIQEVRDEYDVAGDSPSFYPDLDRLNFSSLLATMPRFNQYTMSPIQSLEELQQPSNPEFTRSAIQNVVASYVHPDTPYNGILLWHGVGVGKTCAAISISEEFTRLQHFNNKKTLVVTPSKALQDTWKKEIFNPGKERQRAQYNTFLDNGGNLVFTEWQHASPSERRANQASPVGGPSQDYVSNVQCTGTRYNPQQHDPLIASSGMKYDAAVRKLRNEMYDFSTYSILANKFREREREYTYRNHRDIEGRMIKYVIREFSNRVIILDEIHRVKEEGAGVRQKTEDHKGYTIYSDGSIVEVHRYYNKYRVVEYDPAAHQYTLVSNEKDGKGAAPGNKVFGPHDITVPAYKVWGPKEPEMELKMSVLKMIARYATNTTFVLLSATPMYAKPTEILDILDILRLNDGRALIDKRRIFQQDKKSGIYVLSGEKGSKDRDSAVEYLQNVSRGYISHLRGEDPRTFPLQLYPIPEMMQDDGLAETHHLSPLDTMGYTPAPLFQYVAENPKKSIHRTPFTDQHMNDLVLYRAEMSEIYQMVCWVGLNRIGESHKKAFSPWSYRALLQGQTPTHASNIVFPVLTTEEAQTVLDEPILSEELREKVLHCYGYNGFKKTFAGGKAPYTFLPTCRDLEFLDLLPSGPPNPDGVSQPNGLAKYSAKFCNIMRLINDSKGVVFLYSEYVKDGVDILAMMLERNGYCHYSELQKWNGEQSEWVGNRSDTLHRDLQRNTGDEMRDTRGRAWSDLSPEERVEARGGRFVVLKGGDMTQSQIDTFIPAVRGENGAPNDHGQSIKIVIGSKKMREGFSLKYIRQIHILDPWYHLNAIDQAVGRGIRNYSHILLSAEDRNVTTFLHCASLPLIHSKVDARRQNKYFEDIIPESPHSIPYPYALLESSDEYIYREAVYKSRRIAEVDRILQRNALDCHLNRAGNMFPSTDFQQRGIQLDSLVTSQDKIIHRAPLGDDEDSWKCKFTACTYTCPTTASREQQQRAKRRGDVYVELKSVKEMAIQTARDEFKRLFRYKSVYTLRAIIEKLSKELNHRHILEAIHYIIKHREPVYDGYQRKGYVIYRKHHTSSKSYYIFQPIWKGIIPDTTMDQDESIDMVLRHTPPPMSVRMSPLPSHPVNIVEERKYNSSDGHLQSVLKKCEIDFIHLTYFIYTVFHIQKDPRPKSKKAWRTFAHYPTPDVDLTESSYELGSLIAYPKGARHGCDTKLHIPTVYDFAIMGGLSILDLINLGTEFHTEPREEPYGKWELERDVIVHMCLKATQRILICMEAEEEVPNRGWVNYNDKITQEASATFKPYDRELVTNPSTFLDKTPSLELCGYYYYMGGLPEDISSGFTELARTLNEATPEGTRVYFPNATRNVMKYCVVTKNAVSGRGAKKVRTISSKFGRNLNETGADCGSAPPFRVGSDTTEHIVLEDASHCVYYEIQTIAYTNTNGELHKTTRAVPSVLRVCSRKLYADGKWPGTEQLVYRITYTKPISCAGENSIGDVTLDPITGLERYRFMVHSADLPDRNTVDSRNHLYGYQDIHSRVRWKAEKKTAFPSVFQSIQYFFYRDQYDVSKGSWREQIVPGCSAGQALKSKNVAVIQRLLTAPNQFPYEMDPIRFTRYPKPKETVRNIHYGDTPIFTPHELDNIEYHSVVPNESNVITLHNTDEAKTLSSLPGVALELLLLFRYMRYIHKGRCPRAKNIQTAHLDYTWFLRKDEFWLTGVKKKKTKK